MQLQPTKRISSLDYLRGLAAAGIMCYHMQLLNFGETDASTALAKIKIYGVAIFYILSGLTLYKVYVKNFTLKSSADFYKKRVSRIAPLLLLATAVTYLLQYSQHAVSPFKLLLNIAILPGMLRPDLFIANGAWSIGNECCFYLFFPILLLLAKQNKLYLRLGIFVSGLIFIFFSFNVMQPAQSLGSQWANYVNVLNQFFLFAAGMGLASLPQPGGILKKCAPLSIVLLAILIFLYPVQGEPIVLVTGFTRLALTMYVTGLCYLFYIADFSFMPRAVQWMLHTLGEISYSIYLLHPLVYFLLKKLLAAGTSPYILIAGTIVITLPLSYFVYNRFEKYFVGLGKKNFRLPLWRLQGNKV